jgi:hypothetical protein
MTCQDCARKDRALKVAADALYTHAEIHVDKCKCDPSCVCWHCISTAKLRAYADMSEAAIGEPCPPSPSSLPTRREETTEPDPDLLAALKASVKRATTEGR